MVRPFIALIAAQLLADSLADPENCEAVQGRITSTVVAPETSFCGADQLCTEGKLTGGLSGDFEFILTGQGGFPGLSLPAAVVGELTITLTSSNLCRKGTVVATIDASSFVPSGVLGDNGYFGGVQAVQPHYECGITGGFLTTSGIFNGGCQDCVYNGVVCF